MFHYGGGISYTGIHAWYWLKKRKVLLSLTYSSIKLTIVFLPSCHQILKISTQPYNTKIHTLLCSVLLLFYIQECSESLYIIGQLITTFMGP